MINNWENRIISSKANYVSRDQIKNYYQPLFFVYLIYNKTKVVRFFNIF